MADSPFVRTGISASALPVNEAKRCEISSSVAVSVVKLPNGAIVAVNDSCCHKDAKMSKGDIEDLGMSVSAAVGDGSDVGGVCLRCPKHRKKFAGGLYFNALTGKSYVKGPAEKYKSEWRLATYETRVIGDMVYVSPIAKPVSDEATAAAPAAASKSSQYFPWRLVGVDTASADSAVYRFERVGAVTDLEREMCERLTLSCWHVSLRLPVAPDAYTAARDYTPVSSIEQWEHANSMDILIKVCCYLRALWWGCCCVTT